MQLYTSHTRQRSQSGFTLVEVLVGTMLMAIIFTAAYGSYLIGLDMVGESRQEVRAAQIIQSQLEAMRTYNWDDLSKLATEEELVLEGEFIEQFAGMFQVTRKIEDFNEIQKRVTLWVTWTNASNQSTYRRFTAIFTKNGLSDYYYREV